MTRRVEAEAGASAANAGSALLRELPLPAFRGFQQLMQQAAGIHIADSKMQLVRGRLARRVSELQLSSYDDYLRHISDARNSAERQVAIDLLTTNETYFFREPKHFELLTEIAANSSSSRPLRVWSAACSSGEEPYSIAMLLTQQLGQHWEVLGSDISTRVLAQAQRAIYPLARTHSLPAGYLERFCLKGIGSQEGSFIVSRELRARVRFLNINLNAPLPDIGEFDVIFLRNVMIYFNQQTKSQVVNRLAAKLRPGGYLIIGHSESLNGIESPLKPVRPSVYRKPERRS